MQSRSSSVQPITTIVLSKNSSKVIPSDRVRELDRAPLIKLLLAYGIQPGQVIVKNTTIFYVFDADETQDVEDRLLLNQSLDVDYQKVIIAEEQWQSTLALMKSHLNQRVRAASGSI